MHRCENGLLWLLSAQDGLYFKQAVVLSLCLYHFTPGASLSLLQQVASLSEVTLLKYNCKCNSLFIMTIHYIPIKEKKMFT